MNKDTFTLPVKNNHRLAVAYNYQIKDRLTKAELLFCETLRWAESTQILSA